MNVDTAQSLAVARIRDCASVMVVWCILALLLPTKEAGCAEYPAFAE